MSQRMKTVVVAIIALLLVFALVVPAFAHAQLLGSSPENGSSQQTADELVLTFNENVSPDFVTFYAQGDSEGVLDGEATVDGPVVTQPLAPTRNGDYAIGYRVVSADGHPVSGEITFTLTDVPGAADAAEEPAATEETEDETTTQDAADDTTAEESAPSEEATTATTTDTVAEDEGGSRWIGFAVLAAVAVGLVLLLLTMRGRRQPPG